MSSDDLLVNNSYSPLMSLGPEETTPYWNIGHSITETSFTAMAKDTRVTFDPADVPANKPSHKVHCHRAADRQISYEDAENCVNEMSESFPALSTRAHRIMRQVSGSFNSRTIKVALILSVILNLLLAVPFGIFFGFWMSQRHTATSSLTASTSSSSSSADLAPNCVLCSSLNSLELKNRIRIRFNHGTMCCLEEKHSLNDPDQLFQMFKDLFPCKGGNKDSYAQFTLDVKKTKSKFEYIKDSPDKIFHWVNNGEIGKSIRNLNGTVQVLQDGNYYIFSHLTFSSMDTPLAEGVEEKIVTHSIVKKPVSSRKGSPTLLMDQLTVKKQEIRGSTNSGVVFLEKGEEIFVYASVPNLLKDAEYGNVFGLFLI
ncbi:hypothetical protein BgiMline_032150 [Biomphalaria glabrata]|uniref:Uncharacterized protein LOC106050764 isoform X3 n=1 Tax=Biomphalaria glabrata TaxID=6526 RepID=A0A2C9K4D7_BIOGL|nr:uncharacterized protein LOC106050764 isoform X3 [Biomphalaria glabrata]KAI8733521.1 hypothetical protein BgiMline_028707 [Biomphalaria glabrata]KAI8743695.1 hypothetical protein BgiBS90_034207 [Biomphalaria glabrata]